MVIELNISMLPICYYVTEQSITKFPVVKYASYAFAVLTVRRLRRQEISHQKFVKQRSFYIQHLTFHNRQNLNVY